MARKSSALVERLQAVPDPRRPGGNFRHQLVDILVLAFCGALCGSQDFAEVVEFAAAKEEFFRQFLELPHGIPCPDTFERVFARLDPSALQRALVDWLHAVRQAGDAGREGPPGHIRIDGKTLRRSFDKKAGLAALATVSAWAGDAGLWLGQAAVEPGSNEIPAIGKLLELLALDGAVVTIDAIGCQKEIAARIVGKQGDYVLALKGNHEALHRQVVDYFLAQSERAKPERGVRCVTRVNGGHGRRERRTVMAAPVPPTLAGREEWAGLRSIVMVVREAEHRSSGKTEGAVRYFLSSLPAKAGPLGRLVRSHWQIENGVHWVLDVVFHEDRSRLRKGKAPENWAALNRVALSLVKGDRQTKGSLKCKRKRAGWNEAYFLQLLAGCL
jgi:predicted transposase YbfD/YdcC